MSVSRLLSPPATFGQRLRYLGPSLIVTANIVGAGELIMTTTLGARAGFIALWVILVSCMIKVMIQLEFGKHAINTGETTMEAFTKLPGPTIGRGHWSIWTWLVVKIIHFAQLGGMIGGVALALNMAFPVLPVWAWTWIAALLTVFLVLDGKYRRIETISVSLVALFSVFTIFCVYLLQSTEYAISASDLMEGMSFELPAAVIGVALGAFGITGVSSEEAISYPYWCLEKGYAQYTGEREQTDEWSSRAKGWIKVMYLDAFISMIIYTITTAAFYLLGAAILNQLGQVPDGYATISTLSQIYTESVGPGAKYIFLAGAVIVLFSSVFINAASNQRIITDGFAQLGFLKYSDETQRKKWFRALAWFLPLAWAALFVTVQSPVFMVMLGGLVLSLLLLVVVFAAFHMRYRRLDQRLRPSKFYDLLFWISGLSIVAFGVQAMVRLL
ncbi:MAG: Nramp family divalent metal transporter [Saprospiraceae bacterium]|nr:Nramp family divalent metal transporter [Saprospiraceae bacterium]